MPEDIEKSIEERIAARRNEALIDIGSLWDCHKDEHEGLYEENIKEHIEECMGEMAYSYIDDDRNYIVDGAVISCSHMSDEEYWIEFKKDEAKAILYGEPKESGKGREHVEIDYVKPDESITIGYIFKSHAGEEKIRKLQATHGENALDNGLHFATVNDRSCLRKEEKKSGADAKERANIVSCGNCKILRETDIEKILENCDNVFKYGTCYALINPNYEWKNPYCMESVVGKCNIKEPVPFCTEDEHHKPMKFSTTEGEKEGLTMLSTLLCTRGGLITIESPGQIYLKMPVLILDDWLMLYDSPTVDGEGRSVPRHQDAKVRDWAMGEELQGKAPFNMLPKNSREAIESASGNNPAVNLTSNNIYMDDEKRYWVAVGPKVMNPEFDTNGEITVEDMQYGTKIDIVVQDAKTGQQYYIPAVVGDAKEHTKPNGIYQTGIPFDSSRGKGDPDRSTVEFIGYNITEKIYDGEVDSKSSINITNNFELVEIIVYDGIYNY